MKYINLITITILSVLLTACGKQEVDVSGQVTHNVVIDIQAAEFGISNACNKYAKPNEIQECIEYGKQVYLSSIGLDK